MAHSRIYSTRKARFGSGRMDRLAACMGALGLPPQTAMLVLSDLLALLGTAVLVFMIRWAFGSVDASFYHWVLPFLMLGPLLGACLGLYQIISLPPHQELKNLCLLDSLLYGIILAALFLSKSGDLYSRLVIGGSWFLSLFTLPLLRGLCRRSFGRRAWWGMPVLIFNTSPAAFRLARYLRRHPEHGLKPRRNVDLPTGGEEGARLFSSLAAQFPGAAALLLGGAPTSMPFDWVPALSRHFSKVLMVPSFEAGAARFWLTPCDLGCVVGLELRQNLHDRRRLLVKRCMDVLACVLLLPLLVPIFLLLGLLIRIDSPGPVFFRQERIGQGGMRIRVFKFRSMKRDAAQALASYLADNPHLREEWEQDQKLRHDPRITRMGAILRKSSLDELPQLINVLRGEMSLVGPRPIVDSEVRRYGAIFEEYCRVRPGITGLWQISGRNDTGYAERVALDNYYINSWSVWLDIWILARTLPAAWLGSGAY